VTLVLNLTSDEADLAEIFVDGMLAGVAIAPHPERRIVVESFARKLELARDAGPSPAGRDRIGLPGVAMPQQGHTLRLVTLALLSGFLLGLVAGLAIAAAVVIS